MGEVINLDLMRSLLSTARPKYEEIAQRVKFEHERKPCKSYDQANLLGKVSKHYLRCLLESAPQQFQILRKITEKDSYYSTDNGCQLLIRTTALGQDKSDVCTIDALVEVQERKVLIDIRACTWANVLGNYFNKRKEYNSILDAVFGKDAYDRVLAVCNDVAPTRDEVGRSAEKTFHRGVHIVKLPLTLIQLEKVAVNIGHQYGLFKKTEKSQPTPKTSNP